LSGTPGRLVAALLTVLALALPVSLAHADEPDVRTQQMRLIVPAGPGRPGVVSLDTTLYLPARTPAPSVLVAHGFGGSKESVADDARDLARHGFVALTWSARGFGRSTGLISLDSPDYEVADASRLVDYLATRPEVRQDGPGDPRVGATGASYGGALSLLLAGYDHRVDAIAPVITWNDLGQALFPNNAAATPPPDDTPAHAAFAEDGVFKKGWAGVFFASGTSPRPGIDEPRSATGIEPAARAIPSADRESVISVCGRFVPAVCRAYTEAATSGRPDAATAALLLRSSPASVAARISAPTLLVQGETDTLFGLDQADATARQIASAGGRVSVLWYPGGHDGRAPGRSVRARVTAWFDRYLGNPSASPDADQVPDVGGFEYAVQGPVRRRDGESPARTVVAPRYPGLPGTAPVRRVPLPLRGGPSTVLNPPGGNPAALTSLPDAGALADRLAASARPLPNQTAVFVSDPLAGPLLVAGSARVAITVAAQPGEATAGEAVLFGGWAAVAADGRRSLLGGTVAPMRVVVPAGGAVRVTVTLPAAVSPVPAGDRLVLTIATTDQAYQGSAQPAVWRIALAEPDAALTVPVVPGTTTAANTVPLGPAIGIAVVVLGVLVAALIARLLARRRSAPRGPVDEVDEPLVVDGLGKTYPGGVTAVEDVSFTVRRNQVVGLLGPNGAGKTTLLRMLLGLIRPDTGSVRIFGQHVRPGAPVLSRVGAIVAGPGLLPHLSGAANLRLYWAATGRPAADAHVEEALRIAGLGDALDRAVRTYSHGMRQRLAIAQAMLGLPDLLVLDEPTNGLDPPQIHAMREVLRGYATGGRSVLLSSHLLAEVERTCDHVVVLHRGAVLADGSVTALVADGGRSSFRVDDPERAADMLRELGGVTGVRVEGSAVHAELNLVARAVAVNRLVQAGIGVDSVTPRRRLEDVFLQLVGDEP
jgi:ABC-2 type transport system ATP-binding protein